MVHIRVLGIAQTRAGLDEGMLEGMPGIAGSAHDRDGPVAAVKVVLHIGVGFQLAEERKNVLIGPLVIALVGPGVIVFGQAAQKDLAVDGAGAAHNAATGDLDRLGLLVGGDGLIGPVEGRAGGRGLLARAIAEF